MSENEGPKPTTSDESLVERTRSGDQRAFAELWRRHYRSGARVARQFTSSIDADDLVSEAYTRIYQRVLAGGGPTGAFRPYLYTTIRNLAATWGAKSKDVQVDDIADFEDPDTLEDPAALALDRTLTARAFRSLPERWQSVLWYTEVEGMDPHEVAPILGMSANGVAALSYRAREGLRKAWLQAHINDATASGECQWTISRIGDHARNGLSTRDTERMTFHLATCSKCAIINEEVDEVGSRLALVMFPILLGGVAGGAMLATFGNAGSAMATAADAIPALPEAIGAGAAAVTTGAGALGLFGTATAPVALVGSLAIAVALGGTAVVVNSNGQGSEGDSASSSETQAEPSTHDPIAVASEPPTPLPVDPSNVDSLIGVDDVGLGAVDEVGIVSELGELVGVGPVVGSLVETVTDDGQVASVSVSVNGTGTPGAQLSLQALGQVYATTTVDADGNYSIGASAIPGGLASLDLVQTVDRQYLAGLLGGVLGTVDHLVDALIRPLGLSGSTGGIAVNLVS
jgi:RNA polymerase sigma factor (sigma-70 family)